MRLECEVVAWEKIQLDPSVRKKLFKILCVRGINLDILRRNVIALLFYDFLLFHWQRRYLEDIVCKTYLWDQVLLFVCLFLIFCFVSFCFLLFPRDF